VPVGLEACADLVERVFRGHEIHVDLMRLPHGFLCRRETVGTTANQEAKLLGPSYHLDGNPPGRVAKLQGAVDIEANEICHRFPLLQVCEYKYIISSAT